MIDHQLAVLLLIVAVFGAVAAAAVFFDKRRRRALVSQAERYGLTFQDSDIELLAESFADLPIFDKGFSRSFKNIMRGEIDGAPVVLFDYHFTVSGGKNTTTYRQTVACLRLGGDLPKFELCPENLLHKIGSLFGYQDIDFESHPDFSKSYLLRGLNEERIRSLFSHELLSYMASKTGWSIEGGGKWVVIYRPNRRLTPENFRGFLDDARGISRQFESK